MKKILSLLLGGALCTVVFCTSANAATKDNNISLDNLNQVDGATTVDNPTAPQKMFSRMVISDVSYPCGDGTFAESVFWIFTDNNGNSYFGADSISECDIQAPQ